MLGFPSEPRTCPRSVKGVFCACSLPVVLGKRGSAARGSWPWGEATAGMAVLQGSLALPLPRPWCRASGTSPVLQAEPQPHAPSGLRLVQPRPCTGRGRSAGAGAWHAPHPSSLHPGMPGLAARRLLAKVQLQLPPPSSSRLPHMLLSKGSLPSRARSRSVLSLSTPGSSAWGTLARGELIRTCAAD